MNAELRITLPGPEGSADAQRAFRVFGKIAELLAAIDQVRGTGPGRTTWAISHLRRGSSEVGLMVGSPRAGLTVIDAEDELRTLFDGFTFAQEYDGIPQGWPQRAARIGAEIARLLGATADEGMLLGFSHNEDERRRVTVTRAAADHLSAALRSRQTSIGSLIGYVEEINTHRKRNTARLWLTHPLCSVEVAFREDQLGSVRDALNHRVMVIGRLERNPAGQPLRIQMRDLTVLPGRDESPSLASLAGTDPDFIGGEDPVEYVRNLRDAA